jgi:hypothetical protein
MGTPATNLVHLTITMTGMSLGRCRRPFSGAWVSNVDQLGPPKKSEIVYPHTKHTTITVHPGLGGHQFNICDSIV